MQRLSLSAMPQDSENGRSSLVQERIFKTSFSKVPTSPFSTRTTQHRTKRSRTLGAAGSAPVPGVIPKLAFQRARLSSSASSCAYSATDFFSPGLYPSVSEESNRERWSEVSVVSATRSQKKMSTHGWERARPRRRLGPVRVQTCFSLESGDDQTRDRRE